MKDTRILIVDENAIVRQGLRSMLNGLNGISVVEEAATTDEAIEKSIQTAIDIVLIHLHITDSGKIKSISDIARSCPKTKLMVVTVADDPYLLAHAIIAGASGCMAYPFASDDELTAAIEAIALSETLIIPPAVEHALEHILTQPQPRPVQQATADFQPADRKDLRPGDDQSTSHSGKHRQRPLEGHLHQSQRQQSMEGGQLAGNQ